VDKQLLFVIDATNYVCSHWHACHGQQPSAPLLMDMIADFCVHYSNGKAIKVVAVFDTPGARGFRHQLWDDYKASRKPMPDELRDALQLSRKACEFNGIPVFSSSEHEADDIIASLAAQHPGPVVICSRDKDLHQCLEEGRVTILHKASRSQGVWSHFFHNEGWLQTEYKLPASRWALYQALAGESDGWKGAAGVGQVTALKLAAAFASVAEVKEAVQDHPASLQLSRAGIALTKPAAKGIRELDGELAMKIVTLRVDLEPAD
jgi:5'-3' exonuclease